MVENFVMEKGHFLGVFYLSAIKKSDFSYEKGLKIKLLCEPIQNESARNIEMGRNENFNRCRLDITKTLKCNSYETKYV